MKNINKYIIFTMLFFTCLNYYAQERKIQKADEAFEQYSYIDARKIYLSLVKQGYASQDIYEKLGDSYYYNADLNSAVGWYGKLYEKYKKKIKPEYLFRYSHALKSVKEYDKADKIMNAFSQVIEKGESRKQLYDKQKNYLELIELQSNKFDIVNLDINTEGSDFGPSFYSDDIIYFASEHNNGLIRYKYEQTQAPFLDLFSISGGEGVELNGGSVSLAKGQVNSVYHESSTAFTADGKTMYFTRNNVTKRKREYSDKKVTLLKLFKATLQNKKWTNIVELPFNSNNYSTAHPALSPDGKKLYFASDMPGTKGTSDLYYVDIIADNQYGEPINLGNTINTEGRETFPFISETGNLYFSTDGHVGLGGLDVFISTPSANGSYQNVYNVGSPINSPYDDFGFIINETKKIGYYTSNRKGGKGNDDIYGFTQKEPLITKCDQYLSGEITDAKTGEKLQDAKIILFNKSLEEINAFTTNKDAKYKFTLECDTKYFIRIEKEGYLSKDISLSKTKSFEHHYEKDIEIYKPIPEKIEVKSGDDLAVVLNLNPIYFDLNKHKIRADAKIELQKIIAVLNEYPKIKIDIRSHTDSRGNDNFNKALSQKRVDQTIKYLVTKGGINSSRITGNGYGETQLINNCSNTVKCSESEHQLNRRSEFIIIK